MYENYVIKVFQGVGRGNNGDVGVLYMYFGVIPLGDIDTIDLFFWTDFQIIKIYDREISSRTKPGMFFANGVPVSMC